MNTIFGVKYISIKWEDKNTVLSIEESLFVIDIEIIDEYNYAIEGQTYTRLENGGDGQIAFQITDKNLDIKPYFEDATGNKVPLLKIVDPKSSKSWWIEEGEWLKSYKCRSSPLWNRPGDAKVIFGDTVCNITVRANSFSRQEFDAYLSDFKNDFWYLILQEDSLITGEARSKKVKVLNNKSSKIISEFIDFVEKILNNPKVELKEIQRLKDIKKIRPVPRTFMEIARKGIRKKLTSRDYVPSYNIADNKYILYILYRVYYLVSHMQKASLHMGEIYKKNDTYTNQRLNSFSDHKTIDQEVYENEIKELEERFKEEKNQFENIISNQDHTLQETIQKQIAYLDYVQNTLTQQTKIDTSNLKKWNNVAIQLNKRQGDYGENIQFWGNSQDETTKEWQELGFNESISFQFNRNIFQSILFEGQECILSGYSTYSSLNTSNGGIIHKEFFNYITSIRPLGYPKKITKKTMHIKVYGKNTSYGRATFKGQAKGANGQWFSFQNKNDFYDFQFEKDFGSILQDYQEYIITGYIYDDEKPWNKNGRQGIIYKRYFRYIENIVQVTTSPIEMALNNLKSHRPELEQNNWKKQLSDSERKEQEFEKKALEESLKSLNEQQQDNLKLVDELIEQQKKLKHLIKKSENLKIKKNSYFPNSMTFVQNPNYQGSHRKYKEILNIVGIDENLFIQLQLMDKIGLIEMPHIYERWCLLQIIKVLIKKYHFIPEENWKVKLAQQILADTKKIRNVTIKFFNDDIGREVNLWYQMEMKVAEHEHKKLPDIVLDVKSATGEHRLIMDPKFHELVDIEQQIEELYHKKNYAGSSYREVGKNRVFILHPDTKKSVHTKKTPKKWGHDAYYGEVDMFQYGWDKETMPNHRYGAILLSPIVKDGNYLDNLQRLIGMYLQYSCEDNSSIINEDKKIDPIAKEKIFCIVCGSNEHKPPNGDNDYRTPTKKGYGYRYSYVCTNCQHHTQYNYCWKCQHRLIKNGEYWSYHSAEVLEPFNIKCPYCSQLLRK